jgi:RNA polymerase subunit RPABC4/transcription elongation factor Spt4
MSIFQEFFGRKGNKNKLSKGKSCPSCGEINPLEVKFCSFCGSEFHIVTDTFDAFISYRRETGSDLASLIKIQMENRFHKRIFLDVNELQVGRFDEELLRRIENTPNFIVILSRASLG